MPKQTVFTPADMIERMWRDISPEPNSGCWLWTGSCTADGYGSVYCSAFGHWRTHRLMYTLLREPIPEGLTIDHKCRVRCCVNPDHMEPVTLRENIRRADVGARHRAKTHCPKGHPYSGDNVILWGKNDTWRRCRECGRDNSREQQRRFRAEALAFMRQIKPGIGVKAAAREYLALRRQARDLCNTPADELRGV